MYCFFLIHSSVDGHLGCFPCSKPKSSEEVFLLTEKLEQTKCVWVVISSCLKYYNGLLTDFPVSSFLFHLFLFCTVVKILSILKSHVRSLFLQGDVGHLCMSLKPVGPLLPAGLPGPILTLFASRSLEEPSSSQILPLPQSGPSCQPSLFIKLWSFSFKAVLTSPCRIPSLCACGSPLLQCLV